MKIAVFTFGRFNPPTTGHAMLIQKLEKTALKVGGIPFLFASPSHDAKKNPLTYTTKLQVLDKMSRKSTVVNRAEIRTPFDALSYLDSLQFDHVYMIVGSDRVREFKRNASKYIGTLYKNIKKFDVVSAGQRDPDATGVSGMSASKMRKAVADDDLTTFRLGMPKTVGERDVRNVFKEIKKNMKLPEWIDMDELYKFITEHGHEFVDDIDMMFEAATKITWDLAAIVATDNMDIEIIRADKVKDSHDVLIGVDSQGKGKKASLGAFKKIKQTKIDSGEYSYRETPTGKALIGALQSGKPKDEKDKNAKATDDKTGKNSAGESEQGIDKQEEPIRTVPTPVSTSPINRKSMDVAPPGAKVNVQEISMGDLAKQFGVSTKKGGNLGLQLEFATVLLARIATGQDVEDLKADPKFFTFSEEALKQAKGCISQLGPECLQNLKHSTEVDVRGVNGGEPKTDLLCGDNRFSMKADGGYQFSSANYSTTGKEFRRALETTAQRVSENPSLKSNKYVQEGILKMVESLEAFPKYLLNQEKIDAKVGENPEIIETLMNTPIEYDDGRDAGMMMSEDGSINPECDFISAREQLDSACSEFLDQYNKAPDEQEEFMRLFKEELTHVQVTGEGLGFDDERAAASHVLTPTGIYAATRKYSKDLAEVNTLRLSVKEKKTKGVDVGQRTSARSEVRAGEGLKRAKELANSHKVQIEQIDQQFSNLVEANGADISSLGTTTEDVKNSVNEEDFTHTMVGVSNMELDMSYIPGVSVDDMTDKNSKMNYITIGNKTIEIPVDANSIPSLVDYDNKVNETFDSLFEVGDRVDSEDTTTAKRKEKYNQKNRRAKEKSPKVSNSTPPVSQEKPKAATDVDARFETEIDDPLTSRASEWIGLEPDAKIDRLKEIKDSLYELLADPEMDGKLDPNNKYVKDWYIKSRPFYDAHQEDENSVALYGAASDVKDIMDNWESLDKQYEKMAKKIKKSPVQNTTQHERDFDPPVDKPVEAPVEESVELDEADNTAAVARQLKQAVKKYTTGNLIVRSKGGKTRFIMVAAGHIDNKLRKMMIDLMSPNANIHNKDDISYGNVTDTVISAETRHWVKALGLKESVELDEAQKRTFNKGDRIVGRRGNFKGDEAKVVSYDWRLGQLTVAVAGKKVRVNPSDWNKIKESVELDNEFASMFEGVKT